MLRPVPEEVAATFYLRLKLADQLSCRQLISKRHLTDRGEFKRRNPMWSEFKRPSCLIQALKRLGSEVVGQPQHQVPGEIVGVVRV